MTPETLSHIAELRQRLMVCAGFILILMLGAYQWVLRDNAGGVGVFPWVSNGRG